MSVDKLVKRWCEPGSFCMKAENVIKYRQSDAEHVGFGSGEKLKRTDRHMGVSGGKYYEEILMGPFLLLF